ncbi:VOC family protein [Novosphingobium sp. KCTC 2891]|uniref:VOC family protein n=1 Tax=Novosphingobium sp. KCTC 2891 TaxID=2989730 RepID=UPI00222183F1|nr:VOC family protein [Novosphingobium sp. KCTC 2891]MCW1383704.1 VOC family protein [Novosphingobium sp. KCTC 2891]
MSRIFGATRQVAMVVKDIDTAMAAMTEKMGIGPFFILRDVQPEDYQYRGQAMAAPVLSLAFAFSGDLNIELIQQHDDVPSAYTEYLAARGQGVQHLSSWTSKPEEYDALRAELLAAGHRIAHEGRVGTNRFMYFDTIDPALGMCFEVSEGLSADLGPLVAQMCEITRTWDGSGPVRPFA